MYCHVVSNLGERSELTFSMSTHFLSNTEWNGRLSQQLVRESKIKVTTRLIIVEAEGQLREKVHEAEYVRAKATAWISDASLLAGTAYPLSCFGLSSKISPKSLAREPSRQARDLGCLHSRRNILLHIFVDRGAFQVSVSHPGLRNTARAPEPCHASRMLRGKSALSTSFARSVSTTHRDPGKSHRRGDLSHGQVEPTHSREQ